MGEKLKGDPYRYMELIAYCIPYLAATMSGFFVGAMFGELAAALGLTASQVGLLGSTGWIGTLAFSLIAGVVFIRYDLRKSMLVCFLVMGIFGMIQGYATSFMDLLLYRIAYALAAAAVTPFYGLLKARWFPPEDFALAAGIEAGVGFNMGQIIGVAATPIVVVMAGWQGAFLVAGGLAVVGLVSWLLLGRSYPRAGYYGAKAEVKAGEAAPKGMSVGTAFGKVIRYKETWLIPLGWWGTTGVWMCMFTYWPAFVNMTYGIPYVTAGAILSLLPIGSLIASLLAGFLSRPVGLNKPFVTIPTMLVCLAYFGMIASPDPLILSISSFAAGFGAFVFVPGGIGLLMQQPGMTPEMGAMALSVFTMITTGLGGVAVPLIAGMLIDAGWSMYNAILMWVPGPALLGILSIFCRETGPKAKWRQEKAK